MIILHYDDGDFHDDDGGYHDDHGEVDDVEGCDGVNGFLSRPSNTKPIGYHHSKRWKAMERNFTLLMLVTGGADFLADHQAPNQLMITIKDKIMILVTMMKVPSIGVNYLLSRHPRVEPIFRSNTHDLCWSIGQNSPKTWRDSI